ncbi:tautomerase family protein [Parageobacillus thermoglucosidasius]|nr:tautomerase family protein [Parageobacillus thermoglucosidasius]
MPIITVKLAKGRTVEQKQHFVKAITEEVVKNFKCERRMGDCNF